VTAAAHRSEVWWQIYAPLLVGGMLVLAAAGLAVTAGFSGNVTGARLWADVSTIIVILQVLVGLLPVLILTAGMAVAIMLLVRKLPPYLKVVQDYSIWLAYKTEWAMKFVTQPVLQMRSGVAGLDAFIQGIRKFFGQS
jgi:hypothetical protein